MAVTSSGQLPAPPAQWSTQWQAEFNRSLEWIIIGNRRAGLRNPDGTVAKYVVRGFNRTLVLDLTTNPTQAQINDFVLTVLADIIQRGQVS